MKRITTALALLFASTLALAAEVAPQISLDELKTVVEKKAAVIIDANDDQMYANGHIPGAVSFASNKGKLANLLPKDKNAEVVAYCGGPMCTAWEAAAKEAQGLGYTNVKHFKGGITGWTKAGLSTEKVAVTK